jgi:hypothetical protein
MNLEPYTDDTTIVSRSKFQLRHFVFGMHPTKPMQWRQVLIEAQDMAYKIRSAEISLQKMEIELDRLKASGDPISLLDAEQKELDMVLLKRTLNGARVELQWIQEIADEIGPHTFEDIENDQPAYWTERLARQADVSIASASSGVDAGTLDSMIASGMVGRDPYQSDADKPAFYLNKGVTE